MQRLPILVAEDEPFIALDIAQAIEDAGGEVLGPVVSAEAALLLIAKTPVAGAILDVSLTGPDVTRVAQTLIDRGVPIIVQTAGALPPELADRFPGIVVRTKPCAPAVLVALLEDMIAGAADGGTVAA